MRFFVPILAVIAFAASLGWLGAHNGMWSGAPRSPATADRTAGLTALPGGDAGRARMVPDDGILGTSAPTSQGGDATGSGIRIASLPGTVPAPPMPTDTQSATGSTPTPALADGAPHVDVVRVEPSGESVVAGRAPAGASVVLQVDGQPVSTVVSDANGQFVLLPPAMPAGSHDVELVATPSVGRSGAGVPVRSPETVTVVVADNRRDAPLVTVAASGRPTVVVSSPDGTVEGPGAPRAAAAARTGGEPAAAGTATRIESVEREAAGGRLHVSGRALPNATVRLYLDERLADTGKADPQGRVAFSLAAAPSSSVRVRLDTVEPESGTVQSRSEVAFAPEPVPAETSTLADAPPVASASTRTDPVGAPPAIRAAALPPTRAGAAVRGNAPARRRNAATRAGRTAAAARRPVEFRVLPGQSLWQISQRVYGEGLRYTVIYGANYGQILNPNVIYPGQVFRMPASRMSGEFR